MTKKLTAVYKMDGELHQMTREEYSTKKEFQNELKANGFTVVSISTEKDIEAMELGYKTYAALKKQVKFEKGLGAYNGWADRVIGS